jgi:thiol:disulfide interchange protein
MARTSQRYIPVVVVGIAVALLAVRIGVSMAKRSGESVKTEQVRWNTPEEGMRLARETGKPILFDFTADWCQPCHILDAEVFRNPALARLINERFIAVRVVDRQQEEGRNRPEVESLQQRYGVRGFPTVVFADVSGTERGRMEGFRGREEFERVMERVR